MGSRKWVRVAHLTNRRLEVVHLDLAVLMPLHVAAQGDIQSNNEKQYTSFKFQAAALFHKLMTRLKSSSICVGIKQRRRLK
jgi:hypothetical protein